MAFKEVEKKKGGNFERIFNIAQHNLVTYLNERYTEAAQQVLKKWECKLSVYSDYCVMMVIVQYSKRGDSFFGGGIL